MKTSTKKKLGRARASDANVSEEAKVGAARVVKDPQGKINHRVRLEISGPVEIKVRDLDGTMLGTLSLEEYGIDFKGANAKPSNNGDVPILAWNKLTQTVELIGDTKDGINLRPCN